MLQEHVAARMYAPLPARQHIWMLWQKHSGCDFVYRARHCWNSLIDCERNPAGNRQWKRCSYWWIGIFLSENIGKNREWPTRNQEAQKCEGCNPEIQTGTRLEKHDETATILQRHVAYRKRTASHGWRSTSYHRFAHTTGTASECFRNWKHAADFKSRFLSNNQAVGGKRLACSTQNQQGLQSLFAFLNKNFGNSQRIFSIFRTKNDIAIKMSDVSKRCPISRKR